MGAFGIDIFTLAVACGGFVVCLAGLGGGALALVKLGVIGSYWLKGEDSAQDGGDYKLGQSKDIS
ncbi:MAG: hypothetical protein AAF629_22430 [Chloroflexota bacterium]